MDNNKIYEVISRKLSNEATEKDLHDLKIWLDQSDQNKLLLSDLENYWLNHVTSDDNAQKVFNRIRYRIDPGQPVTQQKSIALNRPWYSRTWLKAAATVVFVLGFSLILFKANNRTEVRPEFVTTVEKTNAPGQKSTFLLSDGTMVKLNSESTLTFPDKFIGTTREVQLNGEAFFEVAHNPNKPFIVRSGDISTTVLGTSFNVMAYPNEDILRVALLTGKVKINNHREGILKDREVTIEPGQMAVYKKRHSNVEVINNIPDEIIAWRDNILIFRDKAFIGMVKSLERWYGVNITIENPGSLDRKFSGKFEDRSLEYVLEVLSYNGEFDFEIQGKNILIIGK